MSARITEEDRFHARTLALSIAAEYGLDAVDVNTLSVASAQAIAEARERENRACEGIALDTRNGSFGSAWRAREAIAKVIAARRGTDGT
jgi:hypothetical protein